MKKNICDCLPEELETECIEILHQPRYRADQLLEQIYIHHVSRFRDMNVLPKPLRSLLDEHFHYLLPTIDKRFEAADGTIKYLFRLEDGVFIESVLIREGKRKTVCFSSQAGCPLECRFCATGLGGFKRNLTTAEIVGQILAIEQDIREKVNNCVAMGQGEPLLNYEKVKQAIALFVHKKAMNLSSRHVTISTVGIVPGIQRLADEELPCRLAISLHSATGKIRDEIVPVNKKYPLGELRKALDYYAEKTSNRITFEYILLAGKNDSKEDIAALAAFIKGLPAFVNIIPFNEVPHIAFKRPSKNRVDFFQKECEIMDIEAFVRQEKGSEIMAACGQLTQ
ncbi:MAG: 23S rRNA (adenine(2503)-C(2))-methyltransferase RlmN [Spirochaetales bacterium]|nr:23S rRNA (adenine(2503)-C(2))-methyltransferase RlmN [Spirochaetales bacterium]